MLQAFDVLAIGTAELDILQGGVHVLELNHGVSTIIVRLPEVTNGEIFPDLAKVAKVIVAGVALVDQ